MQYWGLQHFEIAYDGNCRNVGREMFKGINEKN